MPERPSRSVARAPRDRVLRYAGFVLGAVLGWALGSWLSTLRGGRDELALGMFCAAVLAGVGFILAPYVTISAYRRLRHGITTVPAIDVVAVGIGLIVGGLMATLLALPLSQLPNPLGQILPFVVALLACVVSVSVVYLRKDDLLQLVVPRAADVNDAPERLLLDTSVLIDGRIVELLRTGLVTYRLAVPRFVLRELQAIADSNDSGRRTRGKRGLEVLERLQSEGIGALEVLDVEIDEERGVDDKLVRLASISNWPVLTGDQGLERVARLHGVIAINLNAVSAAMRPPVTAGVVLDIEIVQPGREGEQGVGFLSDGTLVVVENGKTRIGEHVSVQITRTLQTGTGRMAFAQIRESATAA